MTIRRLRDCVQSFTRLADRSDADIEAMVEKGRPILHELIVNDDWLPDYASLPHDTYYRQYLLHCDPLERFSIVSFVWGPGQKTPVHDHTVWGLVGMMRGKELSRRFEKTETGLRETGLDTLLPGEIDVVSPSHGDIHQVSNAFDDRTTISIHVYGANIGAVSRNVYDSVTGETKSFISGYHSPVVPNLWGVA
jgi:predicted metal-dependent enzyme (double-stranded beta helix superfamily)